MKASKRKATPKGADKDAQKLVANKRMLAKMADETFERLAQLDALRDTVKMSQRAEDRLLALARRVDFEAYVQFPEMKRGEFALEVLAALGDMHLSLVRIRLGAHAALPKNERAKLP